MNLLLSVVHKHYEVTFPLLDEHDINSCAIHVLSGVYTNQKAHFFGLNKSIFLYQLWV